LPGNQRPLDIERADQAILRRPERQIDERDRHVGNLAVAAMRAFRSARHALVGASGNHPDRRQQRSQSAGCGGLAGAAIAEHHHAANAWLDRGDQQGPLHLVLSDDRGKWEAGHADQSTPRSRIVQQALQLIVSSDQQL
jgi:hypothetical protein